MEIIESKRKVKIVFEYSKSGIGFCSISNNDLEKLNLRIFLEDGKEVSKGDIKSITLNIKDKTKEEIEDV